MEKFAEFSSKMTKMWCAVNILKKKLTHVGFFLKKLRPKKFMLQKIL